MPTFCRHGRFIERCPICSQTLPGAQAPPRRRTGSGRGAATRHRSGEPREGSARAGVRVRREARAIADGYSSPLVPGLRSSDDARRLAAEIALSSARLAALGSDPPGVYGQARALAPDLIEQATWLCVLTAYLCPVRDGDPFVGIEGVFADVETPLDATGAARRLPDLAGVPLGPRTSHDPGRGAATLEAYVQWVQRAAGAGAASQRAALVGDPSWSAERRFERLFERLALPGLTRAARYELLLLLGRLGLYELSPRSLHLAGVRGTGGEDTTVAAAKRIFGIADALLLDRRAGALADAAAVPVEALDLALYNWSAPARATLGFPDDLDDEAAAGLAAEALGV
jgi:Alpha-glutamyl/putrescinyl thymine pyrophosphorylase clade 3